MSYVVVSFGDGTAPGTCDGEGQWQKRHATIWWQTRCVAHVTNQFADSSGCSILYQVESLIRLLPVNYRKDNLIPHPFAPSHFYLPSSPPLLLPPLLLPPLRLPPPLLPPIFLSSYLFPYYLVISYLLPSYLLSSYLYTSIPLLFKELTN